MMAGVDRNSPFRRRKISPLTKSHKHIRIDWTGKRMSFFVPSLDRNELIAKEGKSATQGWQAGSKDMYCGNNGRVIISSCCESNNSG